MLFVSDELKPPWIVVHIFKHIIIKLPIVDTWPVAPSKDMLERCVSTEEYRAAMRDAPFAMSTKPRLRTAYSLAFQCPEWLEPRLPNVDLPFLSEFLSASSSSFLSLPVSHAASHVCCGQCTVLQSCTEWRTR